MKMKALMKKAAGYDNMELVDVPEPEVSGSLVKVKVAYSGICGTDLHTFQGVYASNKPPVILGHEFSGVVTEVGPDVKNVKVGDRVTSETTFETCSHCVYCETKDYNLCGTRKGLGTQVNGSFAEYVVTREESVHILPENVSLLAAALTEPLACSVHAALERTTIEKGETVLIFGPGTIGILLALVAQAKGAYVILAGVTKDETRFDLAKKLGIDRVVDQLTEDLGQIVMDKTNGVGADRVFECSGAVPAINRAFELCKKATDVVQVGVFAKEKTEINTTLLFNKEIRYVGVRSQKPSTWRLSLDLMGKELVKPEKVVTLVSDLEHWREGFEKSINCEEVKVVLRCSDVEE